mmetsp:Transcript_4135/g.9708  ORF Transcript_4135/g.9708 Transcript_4135/m.9708 type:complete len:225 (+) Transcript_4135:46-720(+)
MARHVKEMREEIAALAARLKRLRKPNLKGMKREAAVLLPICSVRGVPSLLYNLRSENLSSHAGEVSFPGGGWEEGDKTLVDTALREAFEEMGLTRDRVEVIGQLEQVPSIHKVAVTPVVGVISGEVNLEKDPMINYESREIEVNFTVPISLLNNPANWKMDDFGGGRRVPRYIKSPYPIWGMTAYLTKRFLSELAAMREDLRDKRQHKTDAANESCSSGVQSKL